MKYPIYPTAHILLISGEQVLRQEKKNLHVTKEIIIPAPPQPTMDNKTTSITPALTDRDLSFWQAKIKKKQMKRKKQHHQKRGCAHTRADALQGTPSRIQRFVRTQRSVLSLLARPARSATSQLRPDAHTPICPVACLFTLAWLAQVRPEAHMPILLSQFSRLPRARCIPASILPYACLRSDAGRAPVHPCVPASNRSRNPNPDHLHDIT